MGNKWLFCILILVVVAGGGCSKEVPDPPEGMVYMTGGLVTIGTDDGPMNEGPSYNTIVDPFYIDREPVTVAEFREFINNTGYQTEAEQFGNSAVFDIESGKWKLVEGADWEHPLGEDGPRAKPDHPVTQVSWKDARTYCRWAGRRLPTEEEWEFAARSGAASGDHFSWGNELMENDRYKANVWQGHFPDSMTVKDGYAYTSPVGAFGYTSSGLADMGGNVWEWTSDTYRLYEGNKFRVPDNKKLKVIRGGSFLCDSTVCFGYRVTAREFNSLESAAFHLGFRTVKNAKE